MNNDEKTTKSPMGGYGGSGSHELYQRVKRKLDLLKLRHGDG